MAITTAKRSLDYAPGEIVSFKVASATTIPEGAIVSINAAGFAVNGTDAANDVFVGIADETVANPSGGTLEVKVRRKGIYTFKFDGSAAQADVNTLVYIKDNETVDIAGDLTNDVLVGRIVRVLSASLVRVDIEDRV
jgi:hypothetical protein